MVLLCLSFISFNTFAWTVGWQPAADVQVVAAGIQDRARFYHRLQGRVESSNNSRHRLDDSKHSTVPFVGATSLEQQHHTSRTDITTSNTKRNCNGIPTTKQLSQKKKAISKNTASPTYSGALPVPIAVQNRGLPPDRVKDKENTHPTK